MFKAGFARLHSSHIRRFFLMSLHVAQIRSASAVLSNLPLASKTEVFMISVLTSFSLSILRTLPLTWWVYLLIAVWVIPIRLAASLCFIP